MQISENFSYEEFIASSTARKLNIKNDPDPAHAFNICRLVNLILQPVRSRFGKPIRVTSGFRSPALNKAVGGAPRSQHLIGEAADIVSDNNRELFNLFRKMIEEKNIVVGQLINEHNYRWIHVSLPGSHKNHIID